VIFASKIANVNATLVFASKFGKNNRLDLTYPGTLSNKLERLLQK
jgi:hypothetical protein